MTGKVRCGTRDAGTQCPGRGPQWRESGAGKGVKGNYRGHAKAFLWWRQSETRWRLLALLTKNRGFLLFLRSAALSFLAHACLFRRGCVVGIGSCARLAPTKKNGRLLQKSAICHLYFLFFWEIGFGCGADLFFLKSAFGVLRARYEAICTRIYLALLFTIGPRCRYTE